MLVKYSHEILGLRSHVPEGKGLEFRFDKPRPVIVRMTRDYQGAQPLSDSTSAFCAAETKDEPNDAKIVSELDSGLAGSLDGQWAVLKDASPAAVKFLDDILGELKRMIVATIGVFRWREGLPEGPHNPYHKPRGYYSKDGVVWREVSLARSATIRFGIPIGPSTPAQEICAEVVRLVSAGIEEPLGHQLFREAWNQRETNPRSSLVIGVAAAEVGLKKLIGSLAPAAQWLVDEVQTPSFSKMLRKYVPTLPVRAHFQGRSICPPSELIELLEIAVKYRNKLVHAGKAPPRLLELEQILKAVNDLLWILRRIRGECLG